LRALSPQLLLVFAALEFFEQGSELAKLQQQFPDTVLLGCSTAGEIDAHGVGEHTAVLTALQFAHSQVRAASTPLADMADSHAAGIRLGQQLAADDLQLVLLLGQGVAINGSALLRGLGSVLGEHLPVVGGLAADNAAFRQTWTLDRQGCSSQSVSAVGIYGHGLHIGHGSYGGWTTFGPARKVTRCHENILYELDGIPALEVYKRYLGEYADQLPGSGLLFPFSMLGLQQQEAGVIRTILAVDETSGSMTLAGEIEPESYLKLMHATTDHLVRGAEMAAQAARQETENGETLAILVSCVGRKLVMGDLVDEEVEAVQDILGKNTLLAGFYSNGEISPFATGMPCRLHNQTMTITTVTEHES